MLYTNVNDFIVSIIAKFAHLAPKFYVSGSIISSDEFVADHGYYPNGYEVDVYRLQYRKGNITITLYYNNEVNFSEVVVMADPAEYETYENCLFPDVPTFEDEGKTIAHMRSMLETCIYRPEIIIGKLRGNYLNAAK